MVINKTVMRWFNEKPASYLNKMNREKFIEMDLGECLLWQPQQKLFLPKNAASIQKYPHSQESLKRSIAMQLSINPNMIILGNGSDEIIENIPRVFLHPGDTVLVITPTFFRFVDASLKIGAKVLSIATQEKDNFMITQAVAKKISRITKKKNVKLIWLCSPNNPTGIPIKERFLEDIVSQTDALVVIDQVFSGLENQSNIATVKLINKFDNLILLRSFSKVFGFAGIRVGFGITKPNIANLLENWRLPFNISGVSLEIAKKIIDEKNLTKDIKNIVKMEREFLFREINKLNQFQLIDKSQTNIFLLRHRTKNLFQELFKKNILVADFNNVPGLENRHFVRITVGNHKENILLLKALDSIS